MSQTQLPTKTQATQAHAYMIDEIHVPAFLEKLAANGITPRTHGEVKQLLQIGAVLAHTEASGQVKRAEDKGNPFLAHVLNRLAPQQQPSVDQIVKHSADRLVRENELAKTAALIYGHAVAGGELAEDNQE